MEKEKLKKMSLNLSADRENYMSAFRKNIDMYVAEKDIKLKDISEEADIPFSTLNTFLYGDANDCKLSTAVKLARAFGISIDELVGSETIEKMSRESLQMCRNMPDYVVYLIRSFIRHQYQMHSEFDKDSINIPVLIPECSNGYLLTTNVTETVCIDHLTQNIKSKVCLGLKIPCEHYEPFYMPNEIILIAADRDGLDGEKCVISRNGNFFIVKKKFYIENNVKKYKYISLMNNKTEIYPHQIEDKIGYIVGFLNSDNSWGIR